ncbi:MAG TPA: pseudaminic acid cytidylyltransferase [Kiritimatiellia bacterium]|nr:pseudaminic acid cytidylyltransferase [Kiritimatiellia bacterium]HMP34411.1 pseudaminic acid cytidylyltransferase [Kiritimatiellia bacterium]
MTCVAIIPARGGSKRIPGKNIRDFAGRPMIAHSITAALECRLFDRVLVSTDDPRIMEVARAHGAEAPFTRPAAIADDTATTDAVIQHALDWLEQHDTLPDQACCLYATAPFVRSDDLVRGLTILRQHHATTAFSVTSFAYPIFRALKVRPDGFVEMFWPENRTVRSQDLPEAWHDAGQFYWIDVARYRAAPRLFSDRSAPVPLPRHRVQDIDTEEDWRRAEVLHAVLAAGESRS